MIIEEKSKEIKDSQTKEQKLIDSLIESINKRYAVLNKELKRLRKDRESLHKIRVKLNGK